MEEAGVDVRAWRPPVPGIREVLHASLGPFSPEKVHADDSDGSIGLHRVLETVCDTHEVEERDGGAWVELSKRIAAVA